MQRACGIVLLGLLVGCGGSGGGGTAPAVAGASLRSAADMEAYLASGLAMVRAAVLGLLDVLPQAVETGTPGPDDVSLEPGPTPGSVQFSFPIDPDGDGVFDGEVEGTAEGQENTTQPMILVDGAVSFVATLADGTMLEADLTLALTLTGVRSSGVITVDDPVNGYAVVATLPTASPLVWNFPPLPDAGPWEPGNLCVVDAEGGIQFTAQGPPGSYFGLWRLVAGSGNVLLSNRSLQLPGEASPYALPNASLPLPGCPEGSIQDFAGTWSLHTLCDGPEFGTSRVEITVVNATTLSVTVRTPPESTDPVTFDAMLLVAEAPHSALGAFDGSDADGDFTTRVALALSPSGASLAVASTTEYTSGARQGDVGNCGGTAVREAD